jgi:hypothetical protein
MKKLYQLKVIFGQKRNFSKWGMRIFLCKWSEERAKEKTKGINDHSEDSRKNFACGTKNANIFPPHGNPRSKESGLEEYVPPAERILMNE